MKDKIKRNAPMMGMLGSVVMFSTGCTIDDVLLIARILGIFL